MDVKKVYVLGSGYESENMSFYDWLALGKNSIIGTFSRFIPSALSGQTNDCEMVDLYDVFDIMDQIAEFVTSCKHHAHSEVYSFCPMDERDGTVVKRSLTMNEIIKLNDYYKQAGLPITVAESCGYFVVSYSKRVTSGFLILPHTFSESNGVYVLGESGSWLGTLT